MANQWTGKTPPEERFWAKVDQDGPNGCWIWTAYTMTNGYGLFGLTKSKMSLAHRFAYQDLVGPIPEGLVIDHLCRVRNCVNPAHMEVVTQIENVRRGNAGKNHSEKTHCPQGHEYTPENTYETPSRKGGRLCRRCRRERNRVYQKGRWERERPKREAMSQRKASEIG